MKAEREVEDTHSKHTARNNLLQSKPTPKSETQTSQSHPEKINNDSRYLNLEVTTYNLDLTAPLIDQDLRLEVRYHRNNLNPNKLT